MEDLTGRTVTLLAVAGVRYLQGFDVEVFWDYLDRAPIVGAVEERNAPPGEGNACASNMRTRTHWNATADREHLVSPMQIFTDARRWQHSGL